MPETIANREKEAAKIQALIDSDPELKAAAAEFDAKYELHKKMILACSETELA